MLFLGQPSPVWVCYAVLAVASRLMFPSGTGIFQFGMVVALAMATAIFLGAGPLLVTEAGVTALLVVTLDPSTAGPSPDRFLTLRWAAA